MDNPFAPHGSDDLADERLVQAAQAGNREALEALVGKHQAWIYNVALRMTYLPQDAEDATQEILIKLITKLSTFEARSQFRTWLYRIVVNHLLNMKRTRADEAEWTFVRFGRTLDDTPDLDLPDQTSVTVPVALLVDEARIGCTSGMLLCLDREQRLIYILGDIFGVSDRLGAEILETSRANFRQRLSRARKDLHSFMQDKCGLINRQNPCRCRKKTQGFIRAGYVNPKNLLFARDRITKVREMAQSKRDDLDALDDAYAELHRDHPFLKPSDFASSLKVLLDGVPFKSTLDF